jgi:hypothetical protein
VFGGARCCTTAFWNCDAGVTQNLPRLPKLTSLTVRMGSDSITYVVAMWAGEFGLQVRLPQTLTFNYFPIQQGLAVTQV